MSTREMYCVKDLDGAWWKSDHPEEGYRIHPINPSRSVAYVEDQFGIDAEPTKVEPEFVVGQTVSGTDYQRLPVGSKVSHEWWPTRTKVDADRWPSDADPDDVNQSSNMVQPRTITHLPDATQPEDETDAYVEPEPLKEGDWIWIAGQITETHQHPEDVTVEMFSHNEQYQADVRRDRVERMAGVPSWVKPAQCTSLHAEGHYLVRCTALGSHEAHRDGLATTWTDEDESGRITEGGAS